MVEICGEEDMVEMCGEENIVEMNGERNMMEMDGRLLTDISKTYICYIAALYKSVPWNLSLLSGNYFVEVINKLPP